MDNSTSLSGFRVALLYVGGSSDFECAEASLTSGLRVALLFVRGSSELKVQ